MLGLLAALTLAGLAALFFCPAAWHAGLRALGAEAAARRGLRLEVGRMEGTPVEGMILHEVRLSGRGTDLRARRVELRFTAPAIPYFQRPKGSLLHSLLVEGLEGEAALRPPTPDEEAPPPPPRAAWWAGVQERFTDGTSFLAGGLVPAGWSLVNAPAEAFALNAPAAGGGVRARGLRLTTGEAGGPGFFSVRELDARGPGGLTHRSAGLHGAVNWRGTWLTLRGVDLAPGVSLDGLTVEAIQLVRRGRLEGEATVRALGGELRAQGTAGPGADGRPTLAVACTLTDVAMLPLADFLGVPSPVPLGGKIRAGQISFRGDPARPAEGTGSLLAEVVDFRFGSRAWERLRVAASVLPPRATVRELKLVQGVNVLDLEGEFPLAIFSDPDAADWRGGWAAGSVSGRLDARLGDLQAFRELLGPGFPPLSGRLNLRGELHSPASGGGEPEGGFHVEAGPVSVGNLPLDRLRADVRLVHGELSVNDLSANRADDTLSGKGAFRVAGGPFRYAAEGRARIQDLSRYAAAWPPGTFPNGAPRGMLAGEWSGDGVAGSHAGAFKGRVGNLLVPPGGPGALPRPVDVEAEGTYSPDSVAFRRLALRDGAEPKAEFHLRLENVAVPWTQNAAALSAGHFFQPDGTLAGRVEARELALDLVAPLLPARLGIGPGTNGRLSGWADLGGTPRVPRITGAGQLRRARLRWLDPARRWAEADALGADLFLEGGDHLRLEHGAGERSATAGGGALTFNGRIDWAERDAPLVLDVALGFKNVSLLDNRTARVRGDADLDLRGLSNAPEIAGDVRLREGGRFWRALRFAPTPPNVSPASAFAPAALTVAPFADAAWNLHVTAAGPLLLESPQGMRGELRPDLRVNGTGRQPVLRGALALKKTRITLPAAELEVEAGSLRLDPDNAPDDLVLDLPARLTLPPDRRGEPGTRLHANFSGPASEGAVTFSAEPLVWSPAEVAAYLTEGKVPSPATDSAATEPPPAPKLYLRLR